MVRIYCLLDNWEYVDQIELSKASFVAKSGMDYMPVFGSLIWICEKDFSKSKINNLVGNIKKIFNELIIIYLLEFLKMESL